ncbi:hypothetical protein PoB_003090100 [Plakobranchus ocellatus]|uniref:Uncharacterized protein n=1 Tax=Plakobranchus ocellatus TaxID=259542 RepID=A0AAV4ACL4_9GAST|nr:hypothetical protein PoB_003090100 [Plakobranchus ocellatus]
MELLHQHLWPVHERLTSDALLPRCERKATQNANESFHASVWAKCSNTQFHCKEKGELAVSSAAVACNFGPASVNQLGDLVNVPSGAHPARIADSGVRKSLNKSLGKNQAVEGKRRKLRKEAIEKAQREEGGSSGSNICIWNVLDSQFRCQQVKISPHFFETKNLKNFVVNVPQN